MPRADAHALRRVAGVEAEEHALPGFLFQEPPEVARPASTRWSPAAAPSIPGVQNKLSCSAAGSSRATLLLPLVQRFNRREPA